MGAEARRGRSLLALIALGLALLVAPAAASARQVVATGPAITHVAVAGTSVVFSEGKDGVAIAGPGSPARQLVKGPGPNQSQGGGKFSLITYLDFAADSGALAVGTGSEAFAEASPINQTGPTFQFGPLTGPYGPLDDCGNPLTFQNSIDFPALAADGTRVAAWPACSGSSPASAIAVRDATGAAPEQQVPVPQDVAVTAMALAGNALAAVESNTTGPTKLTTGTPTLVVYNVANGHERYRVALPAQAISVDVQSDGKAVVVTQAPDSANPKSKVSTTSWSSPSDPTLHNVTAQAGCPTVARIAGDEIAFTQCGAGAVVSNLAGDTLRKVFSLGAVAIDAFDFDGTHAAIAYRRCDGNDALETTDPTVTDTTTPKVSACPASIKSRTLHVNKHGFVKVALRCADGCSGVLRLRAHGGGDQSSFSFEPRGGSVPLLLSKRLRKLAKRHGGLSAKLTLTRNDLLGHAHRSTRKVRVR